MTGFEYVRGTVHADTILGSANYDVLVGGDGDDVLRGRDGSDYLVGDNGNDSAFGGEGSDAFEAGAGNDMIDGGADIDTLYVSKERASFQISTVDGAITLTDISSSDNFGVDTLVGVEQISFWDDFISIASPIVLDLDGDGVRLIEKDVSNVRFDFDSDGIADRTGWMSAGDGMLVFDGNGNGVVDGASEVTFTGVEGARSDLDGLRSFDSNRDGLLSSLDDTFGSFMVWSDANQDGVSDSGEVLSLASLGISVIDLTGSSVNQIWDAGRNITLATGSFESLNGSGSFSDVAFVFEGSKPPAGRPASSEGWIGRPTDQLNNEPMSYYGNQDGAYFGIHHLMMTEHIL